MIFGIKFLVQALLVVLVLIPVHVLAIPICIWDLAKEIAMDYKDFLEVAMGWAREKSDE